MVGTSIAHYRIDSELGRGGMGIVYKAQDTKLNRTVALKLLPSAMLMSDDDRSRFYREARSAAALSHPNIATVYAIDEAVPEGSRDDDIRPFIAMEYIDGPSLSDRIAERPLDLTEAVKIANQLASALQAAHERNIVHRDIKSSNVMLTRKGDVKVLDFGLAKTLQSTKLTMTGSTLGTASYMCPEQARGEEVDGRADLWSLGVVLYEMISGVLPFPGAYEQAVVFGILNQDPEPLTAIRTGVPMEMERVVDKLLEKDAALRYQGAADVLADLKRVEIKIETGSRVSKSRTAVLPGGALSGVQTKSAFRPMHWLAALTLFCFGGLGAWLFMGTSTEVGTRAAPIHLNLVLPDSVIFDDPRWSVDGTRVLFSADQGDRKGFIVEYDLATGTLTELTDANMNLWPKYSPDGRSIYFVSAGGMLMRQDIGSTQAGPVAKITRKNGFNWISPNEIVFARRGAVLVKDLKSGLEDTLNPEFPGANWFHHPVVMPNTSILFAGTYDGTRAIDLSTREMLPALEIDRDYFLGVTPNGYLLYLGDQDNSPTVWARKFDAERRVYEGQGFVVFEAEGEVAVSQEGHLIYEPRLDPDAPWYSEPNYVYTNGVRGAFVAHAGTYSTSDHGQFRISPDDRYLAIHIAGGGILRLERSSRTTIELVSPSIQRAYPSQFSYDGKWLYFYARDSDVWGVYRVDTEAKNPPEPILLEDRDNLIPSISRDGNTLVFVRQGEQTGFDIWGKNLLTQEEFPIVVAAGRQWWPSVSPDARFVAFESRDARYQPSVLVKDLREAKTVLVAEGMTEPRWDWKGAYLYYESKVVGEIYRVPFDPSGEMTFGEPQTMFSDPRSDHTHWDVSPEADTILLASPEGGVRSGRTWKVVLNWAGTLNDKDPLQ